MGYISPTTFTPEFRYYLINDQKLILLVLHYKNSDNISESDNILLDEYSSEITMRNFFSDVYKLPYWTILPKGRHTLPVNYLEVYEDNLILVYTGEANNGIPQIYLSVKYNDQHNYLTRNFSLVHSADREQYRMFIIACAFNDDTNTVTHGIVACSNVQYADIQEAPVSGTSKGMLLTKPDTVILPPGYSTLFSLTTKNKEALRNIFGFSKPIKPVNADDPYPNTGDEPDDPPDGDFDYNSDDVVVPDLPQTSVTDSGLVTLFAPDNNQLQALARYLWSDAFSLDSFKKLFNNPMDCILGLSILPIHLPHGAAKEITVGNIISTVSCDVCARQYVKLNCGTFTMSRSAFTGGYLDYSPYTKAYLYLPFIGSQQIDIDEFMNTTIGVEYHIDILTGAMFCYVTRNNKLILTYSGNCAENVPLSANDFTSTISSMLSIATVGAGAVATIATAGAAAPALAGAGEAALGARTASSLIGAGATGAGAVMNSKPSVQHSGSLGGGAGAMGCLYPYILFVAPRISLPFDQNKYTGFPSNKIVKIGNLSGFNVIEAVNLSVKGATDAEVSEIEAVLRNGVII